MQDKYIQLSKRGHNGEYSLNTTSNSSFLSISKPLTIEEVLIVLNHSLSVDLSFLSDIYGDELLCGDIQVRMYEEMFIFTHKMNSLKVVHYGSKTLVINRIDHNYVFIEGDKEYSSTDKTTHIETIRHVKEFLKELQVIKGELTNKVLFNMADLYVETNLYDEEKYQEVISDDTVALILLEFRNKNGYWLPLDIVNIATKEIVGKIEVNLGLDNFRYQGNVEYKVNEGFRHQSFATHALSLLVKLVKEYSDEVDKNLYIATLPDNIYSQQVALKNGATLYYDGEVPKGDKLSYLGKVKEVKIYKLDANKE